MMSPLALAAMVRRAIEDKGRPALKARTGGPFPQVFSYCLGNGSAAKFAWTSIHLLSFFT